VDVDVSDCGDGYDDEEDAHGECQSAVSDD